MYHGTARCTHPHLELPGGVVVPSCSTKLTLPTQSTIIGVPYRLEALGARRLHGEMAVFLKQMVDV